MVFQVSNGGRWGPTVGLVAVPGPRLPVPAIETDLDTRLMGVQEGQSRQEFRLIPRDDDKAPLHTPGPRSRGRGREREPRRRLLQHGGKPVGRFASFFLEPPERGAELPGLLA